MARYFGSGSRGEGSGEGRVDENRKKGKSGEKYEGPEWSPKGSAYYEDGRGLTPFTERADSLACGDCDCCAEGRKTDKTGTSAVDLSGYMNAGKPQGGDHKFVAATISLLWTVIRVWWMILMGDGRVSATPAAVHAEGARTLWENLEKKARLSTVRW